MQDWIGFIINIGFAVMLIPTLLDKQKPSLWTSVATGTLLAGLALGGSYHSIATEVLVFINAILWWILAVQRYVQADDK